MINHVMLRMDNGTDFISKAPIELAKKHGVKLDLIPLGKPMQSTEESVEIMEI